MKSLWGFVLLLGHKKISEDGTLGAGALRSDDMEETKMIDELSGGWAAFQQISAPPISCLKQDKHKQQEKTYMNNPEVVTSSHSIEIVDEVLI